MSIVHPPGLGALEHWRAKSEMRARGTESEGAVATGTHRVRRQELEGGTRRAKAKAPGQDLVLQGDR